MSHSRSNISLVLGISAVFIIALLMFLSHTKGMDYFMPIGILLVVLVMVCSAYSFLKYSKNIVPVRSLILYRIRRRVLEHEFKVVNYALILFYVSAFVYELLRLIGRYYALFPILLNGKEFYSLLIAVCSLFVTLLLTIKLDTKTIKTGRDFIIALEYHTQSLEDMSRKVPGTRNTIHIYSPNINLGVSRILEGESSESTMRTIIQKNANVDFIFHCSETKEALTDVASRSQGPQSFFKNAASSKMLKYLYERYMSSTTQVGVIGEMVEDLLAILAFTNVKVVDDNPLQDEAGYYSSYECMFGQFQDIEAKKGDVGFFGEVVTTPQFLTFIKQHGVDID